MNKLSVIAISLLVTVSAALTIFTLSSEKIPDSVASSQGVKMLANVSTNEVTVVTGDMFLSSSDLVYFIVEIRRSYNKKLFVVVCEKHMNEHTTYESFIAEPFKTTKIYELKKFLKNKEKIAPEDIKLFFQKYIEQPK